MGVAVRSRPGGLEGPPSSPPPWLPAACWPPVAAPRPGPASGDSGPGTTITLYNAQHPQTTDALIAAFTEADGHQRAGRERRRGRAHRPDRAGGRRSPADVVYTENSNWLQQLDDRGLLATGRRVHPGRRAGEGQRGQRRLGRRLRPGQRADLRPGQGPRRPSCPRRCSTWPNPEWKGKIEIAPAETDFWPIVASVARVEGDAAALVLARGAQGQRRRRTTTCPTTRR